MPGDRGECAVASQRVTKVLERILQSRDSPVALIMDNGSEFTSNHFDAWAYRAGIQLGFISPAQPVENGFIDSFNGELRDECLSQTGC